MYNYKQYQEANNVPLGILMEDKNTHLEHLEDDILNNGVRGGQNAIAFLNALDKMMSGHSKNKMNVTVKWDGAPAIWAGINPENGKFFVGGKHIFNKVPKINYTNADIDRNHPGAGLNKKLKVALATFPALNIPGIWQGDLLYTSDELKGDDIDGDRVIVFTPNTITYAVSVRSQMARKITSSKIGIVWHTTYTGKTMATLSAKFGANSSRLTKSKAVWSTDATFKDTSGNVMFTAAESKKFQRVLRMAAGSLKSAKGYLPIIAKDIKDKNLWTPAGMIKVFLNSYIRGGQKIENTREVLEFFGKYYEKALDKKIKSLKSKAGKEKWTQIKKDGVSEYNKYKRLLYFVIASYITLQTAKEQVLRKLERAENIGTFLRTPNGYKVTAPEGFVAIDHVGKALKLVDRLEFSRANFTAPKNWK